MKKLLLLLIISGVLISCSQQSDKDKLLGIYKEMLIKREAIADTAIANKEIMKILKKHGYSELQFRQELFELAGTEKNFLHTIDSLRNFAKYEQKRIQDSLDTNFKKKIIK
jgi:uncharacterized Ntn-hydrolase superfamily protein